MVPDVRGLCSPAHIGCTSATAGVVTDETWDDLAMPQSVTRSQVQRMVADGAQLAEVLPEAEYREEHLPDAIHLPLKSLTAEAAGVLDRARPVIVYCWDGL